MKNYTITVNGKVYDVTVEEKGSGVTSQSPATPSAPVMAPSIPVTPVIPEKTSGGGRLKIEAGAAGKVFKVEASVGQRVAKGDAIVILEAMKMEIPVVAPEDGTVASIDVAVGDPVEAGAVLATLN